MNDKYVNYRWAIMIFLWFGTLAQGLTYMSTPPMVISVSGELGLSAVQVALWVNLVFIVSVFISIPAGVLADRFNIERYAGVGLLLMGPFALLRGMTDSFRGLIITSALSSVGWVIFFTSIPRIVRFWFPPREVGTAMGVVFAGYGVGSAVSVAFAQPFFGSDWRRCFLILGIWGIIAAAIWWVGARRGPQLAYEERSTLSGVGGPSIFSRLVEIIRVRTVWVLALMFFFYIGSRAAWLTFSFPFLVTMRGIPESMTGYLLLLDWTGYIVGSFLAAVLSDKLGLRKPFFYGCSAYLAGVFLIFPMLDSPFSISVFALTVGVCFGAMNPMIFVVCAESDDISPDQTGSATGVIISLANFGVMVIPTVAGYILGSLDKASMEDYRMVWLLVALSIFMITVHTTALRETGGRKARALTAPNHP